MSIVQNTTLNHEREELKSSKEDYHSDTSSSSIEPHIHVSGSLEDDYADYDEEVHATQLTGCDWFMNAIKDPSVKAKWRVCIDGMRRGVGLRWRS